jgi:hypothetical protein
MMIRDIIAVMRFRSIRLISEELLHVLVKKQMRMCGNDLRLKGILKIKPYNIILVKYCKHVQECYYATL